MKIRSDFVTNSSSSSFVCYGINLSELRLMDNFYIKLFKKYLTAGNIDLPDDEIGKMTDEDKANYMKRYELSDLLDDTELGNFEIGGPERDIIGITMTTLISGFSDRTLGELQKIVTEEFNKVFGVELTEDDISYYELGWFEG